MSSFIDLDSFWRDREAFPNPFKYNLQPSQVETWFKFARSVRAHPQNANVQPLEFATSVNIRHLTLPFNEDIVGLPRVYVNFRSQTYKDIHLISAIDGRQPNAKFICTFDKIQLDKDIRPAWIHYKCNMEQVMRFRRGVPVELEITTRNGTTIPGHDTSPPDDADPDQQTLCTFELTPYILDSNFDNHMTETHIT